jgi:hypothetical protein
MRHCCEELAAHLQSSPLSWNMLALREGSAAMPAIVQALPGACLASTARKAKLVGASGWTGAARFLVVSAVAAAAFAVDLGSHGSADPGATFGRLALALALGLCVGAVAGWVLGVVRTGGARLRNRIATALATLPEQGKSVVTAELVAALLALDKPLAVIVPDLGALDELSRTVLLLAMATEGGRYMGTVLWVVCEPEGQAESLAQQIAKVAAKATREHNRSHTSYQVHRVPYGEDCLPPNRAGAPARAEG